MKSKKTTYLLLVAVLIVWGLILWKMFFRKTDDVSYAEPEHKTVVETTVADTLMLNYRDPFLGGAVVKPIPGTKIILRAMEKSVAPQPAQVTHHLRYLGRITRDGIPYGLIEINGTLHTMKTGEITDEYRLRTIWQDSVKLEWKNEVCVARLGQ